MNPLSLSICNHIDHEPVSYTAKECPVCYANRLADAEGLQQRIKAMQDELVGLRVQVASLKRFVHQPVSCRVTPAGVSFFANHHPHDGGCIDGLPVHADEELAEVGMGAVSQD